MEGLEFRLISKEHIDIFVSGTEKRVGQIFTPSGSNNDVTNAIQVCGFTEAFDLWGCGVFGEIEDVKKEHSDEAIERIKKYGIDLPKVYYEKKTVMKKDVQLLFDDYESKGIDHLGIDNCIKCYNEPCSCNELIVKREKHLKEKGLLSYKKLEETITSI